MHLHFHIPTRSPSPQSPAAPCSSTPGYHLPAPAKAEPTPKQHHDPPAGPAVRPTEAPSGSHLAPSPDPDPDLTHATVPPYAAWANAPGHELLTGIPHPESRTPAARPAAVEVSVGTRTLAGHIEDKPRPAPAPDGQTRAATPMKDEAATPPALPAQPKHEEPTVDTTEEAGGPPQRREAPLPTADLTPRAPPGAEIPSAVTGQPSNQHASTPANCPLQMAARESSEAPHAGQSVRDLGDQCRAPSIPPPAAHHPPTGHRLRFTRAPPHPRPQHTAATQARRWTQRPGTR